MVDIDPNTTAIYLEPGGDLVISQNGGILMATGWDQVRQRILRRLFTNPALKLPSGISVVPDYLFHPDYGVGLNQYVDENFSSALLNQLENTISQGITADQGIDAANPPVISFFLDENTLYIDATVTLKTGQPGRLVFSLQN